MTNQPDADTRSPWYECFEPQTQPAAMAAPTISADAAEWCDPADDDGACEALFDYYND